MSNNAHPVSSECAKPSLFDTLHIEQRRHSVSVTGICRWWVVTELYEAQTDKSGLPRGAVGWAIYTRNKMASERCTEMTPEAARRHRPWRAYCP